MELVPRDDADRGGLLRLVVIAVIAGALTGVVGGTFRWLLARLDGWRTEWVESAGVGNPSWRWLLIIGFAAAVVALSRFMVRLAPEAGGSGVQLLEGEMRGELPPPGWRVLPVKFLGGLLSIGAGGMALGREGPTVQMGAAIAATAGRAAKVDQADMRTLTAALGGAGLAVAFSAPIGGALFVFEEVARAFRTRLVITTLIATFAAVGVAQLIIGSRPDFDVAPLDFADLRTAPAFVLFGAILGLLGVLYNRLVVALIRVNARLKSLPPEAKAAAVGAVVALIGLASPRLIGSGDDLTQQALDGSGAIGALAVIVLVRWFLGPLCYSVGTPGGLFAPLLVVGAGLGFLVAATGNTLLPGDPLSVSAFAVVGMSTFFTAVVRAPITGVVLVIEMTATTAQVLPMALAAGTAMLVCVSLRAVPIYDTLREIAEGRA